MSLGRRTPTPVASSGRSRLARVIAGALPEQPVVAVRVAVAAHRRGAEQVDCFGERWVLYTAPAGGGADRGFQPRARISFPEVARMCPSLEGWRRTASVS